MIKTCILILGMHRSGTSALTGVLHRLGIQLGTKLMEAKPDNVKGFFENINLVNFNEDILNKYESSWEDHYFSYDKKIKHIDSADVGRLKKLINEEFFDSNLFAIKDPRLCYLFPLYQQAFTELGINIVVLLPYRNPLEVAKSLNKRDDFSFEKSILLWVNYFLSAERFSRNFKRYFVDFNTLLTDPQKTIQEIEEHIGVQLTGKYIECSEAINSFLEGDLKNHNINEFMLTEDSKYLLEEFSLLYGRDLNNCGLEDFDNLHKKFNALINFFGRLHGTDSDKILLLSNAKNILNKENTILGDTIANLQAQNNTLKESLNASNLALEAIQQSKSWKVTAPLRNARSYISKLTGYIKKIFHKLGLVKLLRTVFLRLKHYHRFIPISTDLKRKIYQQITLLCPWLIGSYNADSLSIEQLRKSFVLGSVISKDTQESDMPSLADNPYVKTNNSPQVSIIIPVFGNLNYTLRCLHSISANPPSAPFEVIVIDDRSPDESYAVLSKIQGIRLIQNNQNQGFIKSCNIGANEAAGEYLYFLNNDTEVTECWLDELVNTFVNFPGTGLAGSKLIYPDGRLQEAGGIIWQDGSAWNFGKFQDPLLPVYNYAREVDYCSGASIMVLKSLFDELGGFDEHYLPAYCEDSDLALKIRDKGYRVIYQPLSTVIHYEGITSGTDETQGIKAYQVENTNKLFGRWQQRLSAHQAPGSDVDNAKDRRATRRVLVIDHCTPTPNQDAGSVTVFNLLLLLREMDFQVTFIPEDNFLYVPEYTADLQRAGIEVLYGPYVTSVNQHLKECGSRYDLAFLFRPGVVERHLKVIRRHCHNAKVLYHTVDLHFLRMSREAELYSNKDKKKAADQMRQRELAAIDGVDASIVHSTSELELLQPMIPRAKLHVFPLIMNIKGTTKSFSERRDIVFVGGYQHTPNVDAVQYFVKDIMPLLRKQLPSVCFYVVGSRPPAEIQALASDDVIITGFVEDLNPLLDKMRVSVAPLRYGAGIKGKVGTAMAAGLPVVATSLAAEGMLLSENENILLADTPEAFANKITKIYQDEVLWSSISKSGISFASKAWGAEAAWSILHGILDDFGIKTTQPKNELSLYSES